MKIIERIYDELNTQGKNAADLARHLGVTTGQTTAWKQRKTDPPAKYIHQIAEFLDRSVDYILTGETNIPSQPQILTYGNFKKDELKKLIEETEISNNNLDILIGMINSWK